MPDRVSIFVNGERMTVPAGSTLAAALLGAGSTATRRSVSGEARAPLCGMGVCFECRVTVDGVPQIRSCQVLCRDGMEVGLDAS